MWEHFSGGEESSESETDNNEDSITCVKFLLLVDQLSIDQHHHLSIKDIGNQLNYYIRSFKFNLQLFIWIIFNHFILIYAQELY